MWGYGMHDGGWWMWLFAGLGVAGFWMVVAIVVRTLLRDGSRHGPTSSEPDALRLLDERLARGEVSEEEYLRIRAVLTEKR